MSALSHDQSPPRPPHPSNAMPFSVRSDASVRDSVRVLAEVVAQLSERIELLEARELLHRVH